MSEAPATPKPTTETPAAEVAPAAQASTEASADQALIKENQKYRERAQKAEGELKQRDDDAEKVRLANLEADGKHKELNKELTDKLTISEAANADYADKFKVIQDAEDIERKGLMESLPEEKRTLYEGATLPMANLRKIVADVTGVPTPGVSESRPAGGPGEVPAYRVDMTDQEKKDWHAAKMAALPQ